MNFLLTACLILALSVSSFYLGRRSADRTRVKRANHTSSRRDFGVGSLQVSVGRDGDATPPQSTMTTLVPAVTTHNKAVPADYSGDVFVLLYRAEGAPEANVLIEGTWSNAPFSLFVPNLSDADPAMLILTKTAEGNGELTLNSTVKFGAGGINTVNYKEGVRTYRR